MTKVAILGNGGMLGHMMVRRLFSEPTFRIVSFGRETFDIQPDSYKNISTKLSKHIGFDADYVINCIGAIKPHFKHEENLTTNIFTNSIFPRILSKWGKLTNTKIIHITTDCVFSGQSGQYKENWHHDAIDDYGKSKSLGEDTGSMVIRTSIIGPENGTKRSLLEWVKDNANKSIKGFRTHYWNGLTTLQLANGIVKIIKEKAWMPGIYHVFSNTISKYELVKIISDVYELSIDVEPADVGHCNRALNTYKELNSFLDNPPIKTQIIELRKYEEV